MRSRFPTGSLDVPYAKVDEDIDDDIPLIGYKNEFILKMWIMERNLRMRSHRGKLWCWLGKNMMNSGVVKNPLKHVRRTNRMRMMNSCRKWQKQITHTKLWFVHGSKIICQSEQVPRSNTTFNNYNRKKTIVQQKILIISLKKK